MNTLCSEIYRISRTLSKNLIFYLGKGEFVTETPVGGDEPSSGGHVRIYPDISDVQEDSGPDMTRSQYKGKYLSGCVLKILTLCRIHEIFFQKYHEKAEIQSFPTMYNTI